MSNFYYIDANISGRAMWHLVYDKCPDCGAPSYNGSLFGGVDCSGKCKG